MKHAAVFNNQSEHDAMTQHSTHDDLGHRNLLLKLENLLELAPLENLEANDENVVVLQTEIFNIQQLAKLN